jgi:large subunit ribosomal protein L18
MNALKAKRAMQERRHKRVRRKIFGTVERPRLAVFRSLHHMYAQVIDDVKGSTLAAASTQDKGLRAKLGAKTSNIAAAAEVGRLLAERAIAAGFKKIVFDRGGFRYHGRVKALADAARKAGLEF